MEIKGALIKIQEVPFAIIEVESKILSDDDIAKDFIKKHAFIFPKFPIVLMSYDNKENPIYYGKKEIIELLVTIHPKQIPWKKYVIKKK